MARKTNKQKYETIMEDFGNKPYDKDKLKKSCEELLETEKDFEETLNKFTKNYNIKNNFLLPPVAIAGCCYRRMVWGSTPFNCNF